MRSVIKWSLVAIIIWIFNCSLIEGKGKCSVGGHGCPRWTDRQNMRYCCTSGCCDYSQYGSLTCRNNVDCPGRLGRIDETYCCESGCCDLQQYSTIECRNNFDCPGRYGSDSATYCCKSGCCDFEQYSLTTCTNGERCPGRYGEKEDTFCCPDGCCGQSEFLNFSLSCTVNSDCANETLASNGKQRELKYCCAGGVCCDIEPFVPNTIILGIGSVIGIICLCLLCCGCCAFAWFMNSRAHGTNPRMNIRAQPVIQVPLQMNNSGQGYTCQSQQPMLQPQQPYGQPPPIYAPQGAVPQQGYPPQQYQQPYNSNYPMAQQPPQPGQQPPAAGYPQQPSYQPTDGYSKPETLHSEVPPQDSTNVNVVQDPGKMPQPPPPGFNA